MISRIIKVEPVGADKPIKKDIWSSLYSKLRLLYDSFLRKFAEKNLSEFSQILLNAFYPLFSVTHQVFFVTSIPASFALRFSREVIE